MPIDFFEKENGGKALLNAVRSGVSESWNFCDLVVKTASESHGQPKNQIEKIPTRIISAKPDSHLGGQPFWLENQFFQDVAVMDTTCW